MKKLTFAINMMMCMCMWMQSMCMPCCALISDMLSCSKVKCVAA